MTSVRIPPAEARRGLLILSAPVPQSRLAVLGDVFAGEGWEVLLLGAEGPGPASAAEARSALSEARGRGPVAILADGLEALARARALAPGAAAEALVAGPEGLAPDGSEAERHLYGLSVADRDALASAPAGARGTPVQVYAGGASPLWSDDDRTRLLLLKIRRTLHRAASPRESGA